MRSVQKRQKRVGSETNFVCFIGALLLNLTGLAVLSINTYIKNYIDVKLMAGNSIIFYSQG